MKLMGITNQTPGRPLGLTWTKLVMVLCLLAWVQPMSHGITHPITPSVESTAPSSSERWQQHETQRIQILFQPQDQQAAMEIASYADEIVEQLSEILEYSPPELIPVVLRGQTDQANGYFTVGPKRVVLMVSPDSRYPGYFGPAESWLRLVFTHELVHYIQLTRPIGLPGTLSRWLGELPAGAAAAGTLPGWFIEGTAVYLETLLTSGGRGRSGAFTMEILANLYDLDSWTYTQAGYDALASFDSRIYRSGYILVSYIAQEFGFDLLNRLQEATWSRSRIEGAMGFDQHLERLTGISNDELWARAQRAFLHRYWEQLSQLPGTPWQELPTNPGIFSRISLPEPVDGGWIISYQDVWTPGSLAFVPKRDQSAATSTNPTSPQIHLLTPAWLQHSQSFAAEGSWVVFSQREFRTNQADSSATTTGLYLGKLDLSNSSDARLTNIVPLRVNTQDNLLLDLHSPAILIGPGTQPRIEQRAQQESVQQEPSQQLHILALERLGSSHRLISLVDPSRGQSISESSLGPGLGVSDGRVLSQELERQVVYQGDTRLGGPRVNPSGTLVALPEYRGALSRILLINSMTGEVLDESTPWVHGSVEHPRWFSDEQLVITLDSQGFRKPYLIDITQPGLWLKLPSDPVGTGAAMIDQQNQLIYQTVRSRSHQILAQELPLDFEQLGQFQPMSHSQVQEIDRDVPRDLWVQTPATNLLRFHTWFPNLLIRPSAFGTEAFFLDFDLAPGAGFLFNDPVEEQSLAIQGALYVRSLQPDFLVTYNRLISRGIFGPQGLGISLQQTYQSSFSTGGIPEGVQSTSLTFQSQSTLGQWNSLGHTTRILGALALRGSWTLQGRREFSLAHGFQSVQVLDQSFSGVQDDQTLLSRPDLTLSGGLGLAQWSVNPRWAFYGGNQYSLSTSILVSPDLTGYTLGAPTLAGLANFNLGRLVYRGSLFRFRVSTAVSNGLNGSSLLELPGGFLPSFPLADGALGTSAHFSIPLGITDFKVGGLVLDRIGLSLGAHWQAGFIIPWVRNAALEDSLLARSAWLEGTGSSIGAPGTSAQAFDQVPGGSLSSLYTSNRFLPSRFLAITATLDLGIGVWAPQRPLLQAGVSVKIPLSTTESWGLLPLILFDLANILP